MQKKFRILCPYGAVSGGPEALHQLCHALLCRGVDAAIVYVGAPGPVFAPPEAFARYRTVICNEFFDAPDVIVVISEVMTDVAERFEQARVAIWWLSVDNYFRWRKGDNLAWLRSCANINLAQSAYAMHFLESRAFQNRLFLTDYVADVFSRQDHAVPRIPAVRFNPRKDRAINALRRTRGADSIDWIALAGMDAGSLAEAMSLISVYIDFGNHPGRDRMPREAALKGAVVITGRRGAAAFVEDVPLPPRFRLDDAAPGFEAEAIALIRQITTDPVAYSNALEEQRAYQAWAMDAKARFDAEVGSLIDAVSGQSGNAATPIDGSETNVMTQVP